jgi:hypothetical protein
MRVGKVSLFAGFVGNKECAYLPIQYAYAKASHLNNIPLKCRRDRQSAKGVRWANAVLAGYDAGTRTALLVALA